MTSEKKESLLEQLTSAAANFAYEENEQIFSIDVTIDCEDGWVRVLERKNH